jgi:hypothetical protein
MYQKKSKKCICSKNTVFQTHTKIMHTYGCLGSHVLLRGDDLDLTTAWLGKFGREMVENGDGN